jgi:16S rRNA A1518/A1519 N6-dimethyltransferase RsmA/KsgA/DIM1 with predicted DNA glycosylase/AP lyase activity
MNRQEHWETIYAKKQTDEVSWYAPHLMSSIKLIESARLGPEAAIIDIGGGASTLVDDLLDRGFRNITVLDISSKALEKTKQRLGGRADLVN